ncbi:hypothetical protein [Streptomyces sp. NPDC007205]|uniref:hypothetical protein n=1 Tax=Streptomyces sp. NPDC007205 TaxID=3154316 RepID=UPI0033C57644
MILTPATVEDTIEQNVQTVANQLRIQVRSALRYFDACAVADSFAQSVREVEGSGTDEEAGQAFLPPQGNPELALIPAGVPDALAQTGGDLYAVIINVAALSHGLGLRHVMQQLAECVPGDRGPLQDRHRRALVAQADRQYAHRSSSCPSATPASGADG